MVCIRKVLEIFYLPEFSLSFVSRAGLQTPDTRTPLKRCKLQTAKSSSGLSRRSRKEDLAKSQTHLGMEGNSTS